MIYNWLNNGKEYLPIYIRDSVVGHKLRKFSPTLNFWGHAKNKVLIDYLYS